MEEMEGLVRALVAPAVLITACGMLCVSASARLNSALARLRALHGERLEVYAGGGGGEGAEGRRAEVNRLRFEGLEHQAHRLMRRVALLRNQLVMYHASIGVLVLSSLVFGVASVVGGMHEIGMVLFVLGLVGIGVASAMGLAEVSGAMAAVRYEHERVEGLGTGAQEDGS